MKCHIEAAIVDNDPSRSLDIFNTLKDHGIVSHTFDNYCDFLTNIDIFDVIIAFDDGIQIKKIIDAKYMNPPIPVIAYTSNPSVQGVVQAFKNGVSDYIPIMDRNKLFHAVKSATKYTELEVKQDTHINSVLIKLTKRETEVLTLLSNNFYKSDICSRLGISENTMKTYKNNILRKTGYSNIVQLLFYYRDIKSCESGNYSVLEYVNTRDRDGGRMNSYIANRKKYKLTNREKQVISFVSQGMGSHEIGKILGISPRTVHTHRANILSKLNAKNSSEAVIISRTLDII